MRTLASPIGVQASLNGASNWHCCCGFALRQQTRPFPHNAPARLARPSNVQCRSRASQRASVMRLSLTGASFGRARLNSIDLLAARGRTITFVMLAVPVLLFVWAKAEAHLHDTTEAQQLLSTYLVAASGAVAAGLLWACGRPKSSLLLRIAWQVAAVWSLWVWRGLGTGLNSKPGWLHQLTHKWRWFVTGVGSISAITSAVYYNSIRNTGITLPAAFLHSGTLQVLGSQIAMGLTVTWGVVACVVLVYDKKASYCAVLTCVRPYIYMYLDACVIRTYQTMSRRVQQFTHDLGDFESIDDERRSVFDLEKTSWYERTKNTRGQEAKDDIDTIHNFMKLINTGFHAREVNESFRKRYFSRLNRFRNEGRDRVMKQDWNNVSVILKYHYCCCRPQHMN
eukprot:17043-Heterococcus_DN1.PRE.2